MAQYRRNYAPGGTYFFTACLHDRSQRLLIDHVDELRNAFRLTRNELPFEIDAIVILPEHLHAIWTLPQGDANYSTRWKRIKARFSRAIPRGEFQSVSRHRKGERGIWQRRYWEHEIRNFEDYGRHVDYIHFNPVKHQHCLSVKDWPYSSFHRYVARGELPLDWGGSGSNAGESFGE